MLNYVSEKDVAYASGLVSKGKVFALGMNLPLSRLQNRRPNSAGSGCDHDKGSELDDLRKRFLRISQQGYKSCAASRRMTIDNFDYYVGSNFKTVGTDGTKEVLKKFANGNFNYSFLEGSATGANCLDILIGAEQVVKDSGLPGVVKLDGAKSKACLEEPVTCYIHAMDRLDVKYGEDVLVFGEGPNGITLSQLINHPNAGAVVAVSTQSKLDILKGYGIETQIVDRNDPTVHANALRARFDLGVNAIVEGTGSAEVLVDAV